MNKIYKKFEYKSHLIIINLKALIYSLFFKKNRNQSNDLKKFGFLILILKECLNLIKPSIICFKFLGSACFIIV